MNRSFNKFAEALQDNTIWKTPLNYLQKQHVKFNVQYEIDHENGEDMILITCNSKLVFESSKSIC